MAEDVVDLTEVGGYAQIHDRERAALRSSSAGLVKRHVRWDEAWSGRLPSASRGDAEERSDGRRHERASSARRVRASSPEPLQRPWVGPRSRVPGPPPADVSRRASSQPRSGRLSRDEELFRRDRGALGARFDDDLIVRTSVEQMSGARIVLSQDVMRGKDLLFSAQVKLVALTLEGQPTRLPANIRRIVH